MWFSDKPILKQKKEKSNLSHWRRGEKLFHWRYYFTKWKRAKRTASLLTGAHHPGSSPLGKALGNPVQLLVCRPPPGRPGLQVTPPTAWKPHNNTRMFPLQTSPGGPRLQETPPTAWKPHGNTCMFLLQTSPRGQDSRWHLQWHGSHTVTHVCSLCRPPQGGQHLRWHLQRHGSHTVTHVCSIPFT